MENKYWVLIIIGMIVLGFVGGLLSYKHGSINGFKSGYEEGYGDGYDKKICACICPIFPDPNDICTGPITWCGPDKVGEWQIINGKCQWVCRKIIGGCATVHPDYGQQCCERWARENNVIIPMCVGEWEVINGRCSWNCRLGIAKIK